MRMCLYSVPGPVGSVSSIMNTTWAVISWSVPSYIPLKYPIIRYEIGYHHLNDKCCFMADVDDMNIQVLNCSNVSSDSTFINITGLNDNTCYIFGVRAGTVIMDMENGQLLLMRHLNYHHNFVSINVYCLLSKCYLNSLSKHHFIFM